MVVESPCGFGQILVLRRERRERPVPTGACWCSADTQGLARIALVPLNRGRLSTKNTNSFIPCDRRGRDSGGRSVLGRQTVSQHRELDAIQGT